MQYLIKKSEIKKFNLVIENRTILEDFRQIYEKKYTSFT